MIPLLLVLGFALDAAPLTLPPVPREFRAAWIATVDNIDWPLKRGLSTERQKAEMVRILDRVAAMKMNAVILQVRPAADALYDSKLEPWSEYLTGKQGRAPAPYYDPLEFAVAEAHKRGLELHAWFNPYRAFHPSATGPLDASHIANTNPELVRRYGKMLWMDPGEPKVRERSLAVISDVVRRYDIDGVHFDDYFYPYPEGGQAFPDDDSFAAYGGGLDRDAWRRKNVDDFVESIDSAIHGIKPWVQFGISPFGIYRPGQPPGIQAGVDQYAQLYADPRKWLQEGWCDYIAPQLYWPIAQKAQSFPVLLKWWVAQNRLHRHVWPGLYTSRTLTGESKAPYAPQELANEIRVIRRTAGSSGHIHFSMKALSQDARGICECLAGEVYESQALPPETPWLDARKPAAPLLFFGRNSGPWRWEARGSVKPFWFSVWLRYGKKWLVRVLPGGASELQIMKALPAGRLNVVAISAVSRCGIMSRPTVVTPL